MDSQLISFMPVLGSFLNLLSLVALLFTIIGGPFQIYKRFKRKNKGQVVSPITLIIKKILKYWIITAVILIPLSAFIAYVQLISIGASQSEIAETILLQSIIGNVLTSLVMGYFFMLLFKDSWSYSADPANIKTQ
uniref:hypothetical protein n=1 Tax=Psychrobacter sp. TaxID=56811 RepID=UPI0015EF362D|nr:hypothetical protein [Psychrobacter sp.]